MIEVNLLPAEWRPAERTPWPRLVVILAAVLLVGVEVVFLVSIFFTQLPQARDREAKKAQDLDKLRRKVMSVEGDQRRIQEIRDRLYAMIDLRQKQTKWWPMLFRLGSRGVTQSGIWLTEVSFEEKAAAGRVAPGPAGAQKDKYLILKGYSIGSPEPGRTRGMNTNAAMFQCLSEFMDKLQRDKAPGFFDYFDGEVILEEYEITDINPPSEAKSEGFAMPRDIPGKGGRFVLRCKFKSPEPEPKAKAGPGAGQPQKPKPTPTR